MGVFKDAKKFVTKYNLTVENLTVEKLEDIIRRCGFTIIRFNKFYNDEDIQTLIDSLHLNEKQKIRESFISVEDNRSLLFMLDGLSDDDIVNLYLHELYHIISGDAYIDGKELSREWRSNEFVVFVNMCLKIKRYLKISIAIILVVATIVLGAFIIKNAPKISQSSQSAHVWITKTGTVYHTDPDCYHIKGKDSLIEITVEEAKTHELEQCKDCEKQR